MDEQLKNQDFLDKVQRIASNDIMIIKKQQQSAQVSARSPYQKFKEPNKLDKASGIDSLQRTIEKEQVKMLSEMGIVKDAWLSGKGQIR